jgi:hypothetical protein
MGFKAKIVEFQMMCHSNLATIATWKSKMVQIVELRTLGMP